MCMFTERNHATFRHQAWLAQSVARETLNLRVVGSTAMLGNEDLEQNSLLPAQPGSQVS